MNITADELAALAAAIQARIDSYADTLAGHTLANERKAAESFCELHRANLEHVEQHQGVLDNISPRRAAGKRTLYVLALHTHRLMAVYMEAN